MKLINNYYPQVTSFNLLGTPIALAESLSAMHRANDCLCEIFTMSFYRLKAKQNMQI